MLIFDTFPAGYATMITANDIGLAEKENGVTTTVYTDMIEVVMNGQKRRMVEGKIEWKLIGKGKLHKLLVEIEQAAG